MTLKEYIDTLPNFEYQLAHLYLPVISRWVEAESWDVVREWLFAYSGQDRSWYRRILRRMNKTERRAEDRRRLAAVKEMAKNSAERIRLERGILQMIITQIITGVLSKL